MSSSARKYPVTQNPRSGTTVWPATGTKPRAKSRTAYSATRTRMRTLSRAEIHSSRHSGSPDSGALPPSARSTSSESDS